MMKFKIIESICIMLLSCEVFGNPNIKLLFPESKDDKHIVAAVLFKKKFDRKPENIYVCKLVMDTDSGEKILGEFGGIPSSFVGEFFPKEFQTGFWLSIPIGKKIKGAEDAFLINKVGKYRIDVYNSKGKKITESISLEYFMTPAKEGFVVLNKMNKPTKKGGRK